MSEICFWNHPVQQAIPKTVVIFNVYDSAEQSIKSLALQVTLSLSVEQSLSVKLSVSHVEINFQREKNLNSWIYYVHYFMPHFVIHMKYFNSTKNILYEKLC
jgi:hypothetical protein